MSDRLIGSLINAIVFNIQTVLRRTVINGTESDWNPVEVDRQAVLHQIDELNTYCRPLLLELLTSFCDSPRTLKMIAQVIEQYQRAYPDKDLHVRFSVQDYRCVYLEELNYEYYKDQVTIPDD